MSPKVSVVIPLYNHVKFIKEALENVLNQSEKSLEVIIIDDGSKDNSCEVVLKMADVDERIRYFYQENRGAHVANQCCVRI